MPGVAVYDAIFKVQPTIPDPGAVPALAGVHSLPSHVIVETIEVKVHKADRDRFIRTIKRDAIAAGGWTKGERSPLRGAKVFTVVVAGELLGEDRPPLGGLRGCCCTPQLPILVYDGGGRSSERTGWFGDGADKVSGEGRCSRLLGHASASQGIYAGIVGRLRSTDPCVCLLRRLRTSGGAAATN